MKNPKISDHKAKTAFSTNPDIKKALAEIKSQLGDDNHSLIIFFASPEYSPKEISAEFQKTFNKSQTIGCTTAGEIVEGALLFNSIVAIALNNEIIKDFDIAVIDNLNHINETITAFNSFKKHFDEQTLKENPENYVGLILVDGLSHKEESLISMLNDLTSIKFIGGSAGDNSKLEKTFIYANGKSYTNAAVLLLMEPKYGFKILKTQSFKPIGKVGEITDIDEKRRCLKTIDNIPVSEFYATQIGCPVEEVEKYFINYSFGIMIYGEAYIHDIKKIDKDKNFHLYSSMPKNSETQVLRTTDIIKDLKKTFEYKIRPLKNISAIIDFDCASRYTKIKQEKEEITFKAIYKDIPSIGFATYGEFFDSFLNQTSVMLILF